MRKQETDKERGRECEDEERGSHPGPMRGLLSKSVRRVFVVIVIMQWTDRDNDA